MKVKKFLIKLLILVVSIVLAHFLATPIGEWIQGQTAVVSFDFYVGDFPGYLDGLVVGYVFISALLFPLYTQSLRSGFYWALPALLLLLLTGTINPQLWLAAFLLAVGLGLAWVILKLKTRFSQSQSQK